MSLMRNNVIISQGVYVVQTGLAAKFKKEKRKTRL